MENGQVSMSWLDRMKSSLNVDTMVQKLRMSKGKLIEIALYFGAGFLTGFLLRKYAQYVVVGIVFIVALAVLQQLDILSIVINWNKIYELFGMQPTTPGTQALGSYWEWVKNNFLLIFSFSTGFLLGLKVG